MWIQGTNRWGSQTDESYAAAKGDNTAMRLFAKLLGTFAIIIYLIIKELIGNSHYFSNWNVLQPYKCQ